MQTKLCPRCGIEKNTSEFYYSSTRKGRFSCYCKECGKKKAREDRKKYPERFKARQNKWRNKLKEKMVDYKGGKCQAWGYQKCLAALEFHHINPEEKEFQIGGRRGVGRGKWNDTVRAELDKCILLCANCHREAHATD